jgi:acyl-CoA reductase-like NAD-dependent aldehyde dehydrogenase
MRKQLVGFLNQKFYNLIDGRLCGALKGAMMNVVNPADNKVVAAVPKCTAEDVELAVAAAKRARNGWKNTYVGRRAKLLYKLGAIIESHAEELALMETAQYGGPVSKTRCFDIPAAVEEFSLMAGMGRSVTGSTITADPLARMMTLREPYGVVGLITPWNFPLVTAVSKLGPALITGNTVVLKPPSCAPLTVLKMAEYAVEAGFPAGVINIITGPAPSVERRSSTIGTFPRSTSRATAMSASASWSSRAARSSPWPPSSAAKTPWSF